MALIVGGTTVTGTQTLDATKLTGNLPAISGASLTSLNGSNVSSGTLGTDRIPNFNGSGITSGTMSGARISGGTFGSTNGSNLTSLPSGSSIPVTSYQSVGMYVMMNHDNQGTFSINSTYSNMKASGVTSSRSNNLALSGTYRSYGYEPAGATATLGQRIS